MVRYCPGERSDLRRQMQKWPPEGFPEARKEFYSNRVRDQLQTAAWRFRSTISGVSGFGWAERWCEGTKHGCTKLDETGGSTLHGYSIILAWGRGFERDGASATEGQGLEGSGCSFEHWSVSWNLRATATVREIGLQWSTRKQDRRVVFREGHTEQPRSRRTRHYRVAVSFNTTACGSALTGFDPTC